MAGGCLASPPLPQERYFEGWPCTLARDESRGRFLVATRDLAEGETVLVSEAYLSMILASHKKRVCAFCYRDCRQRLALSCGQCGQAHYCSEACRAAHAAPAPPPALGPGTEAAASCCSSGGAAEPPQQQVVGKAGDMSSCSNSCYRAGRAACQRSSPWALAPRSAAAVPHALLCGVGRQFGSVKWSTDVESVMLGVLQLLAMEHLEAERGGGGGQRSEPGSAGGGEEQQERRPSDGSGAQHAKRSSSLPELACAAASTAAADAGAGHADAQQQAREQQQQQQQAREPAGTASAAHLGAGGLPSLGHADFLQLCSHAADWDAEERRDWLKYAGQLLAMLRRAGWPGPLPPPEGVLDWAGRIMSNNFGIYAPPPAPPAPSPPLTLGADEGSEADGQGEQAAAAATDSTSGRGAAARSSAAAAASNSAAAAARSSAASQRGCREELIGRELYITASYCNHSCEPSCTVVRGFEAATILARRAIKAGEELTISYIDLMQPRSARRAHLCKYFHFDCACPRCEREAVEGSAQCSYVQSKGKTTAPKRRGRKARVSR